MREKEHLEAVQKCKIKRRRSNKRIDNDFREFESWIGECKIGQDGNWETVEREIALRECTGTRELAP